MDWKLLYIVKINLVMFSFVVFFFLSMKNHLITKIFEKYDHVRAGQGIQRRQRQLMLILAHNRYKKITGKNTLKLAPHSVTWRNVCHYLSLLLVAFLSKLVNRIEITTVVVKRSRVSLTFISSHVHQQFVIV